MLIPGVMRPFVPVAPRMSEEDKKLIQNIVKAINFLSGGEGDLVTQAKNEDRMLVVSPRVLQASVQAVNPNFAREVLPFLPSLANEVVPKVTIKLLNRVAARAVREVFVDEGRHN